MQEQTYQEVQAEMTKALDRPDQSRLREPGEDSKLARLEQVAQAVEQPRLSEADRKRLHRRWAKLLRRVERPKRLTKRGYTMQPDAEQDEQEARLGRRWTYRLTSREVERRKTRRKMQQASRRANRS